MDQRRWRSMWSKLTLAFCLVAAVGCDGGSTSSSGGGGQGASGGQGGSGASGGQGGSGASGGASGGQGGAGASGGASGGQGGSGASGGQAGAGGAVPEGACGVTENECFAVDSQGMADGCAWCAMQGPCKEVSDASNADSAFFGCSFDCTTAECIAMCADQHPESAQKLQAALSCIYCNECPNDCIGQGVACQPGPLQGCDAIGFCSTDGSNGCYACAVAGACADEDAACDANPACQEYLTCVGDCDGPACEMMCETANATGAALAKPYLSCLLCDECRVSCASDKFQCGPRFPTCDSAHDCGSSDSGCLGCALQGPCKAQLDACVGSPACAAAISCQQGCSTADCVANCKAQEPVGSQLYEDFLLCGFCEQCPGACGPSDAMPYFGFACP